MAGLALLLGAAALGFGLAHATRLPVIPLLLVLGIGLSATGIVPEEEFTRTAVELGLTFLVFASGIELNPRRFGEQRGPAVWVGALQFVGTGAAGYLGARLLGFDELIAVHLAFALAASSTLVALRQLQRRQQTFEPFGRLATGVLLLQDLAMIVVIVVMTRLPAGLGAIALGLGGLVVLGGLALVCQRWVTPLLVVRMRLDEETLLLSMLAVLFTFAGIGFALDIPPIAGAFLAGFSLSAFPVNGVARGLLSSLSDFFLALFFTALGALVVVPDTALLLKAFALALLVVVLTPPLVTVVAEWTGLTSRAAIESGLLLAQTSEFSLVLGLTGFYLGQIPQDIFSVIALVTVVTMSLTPFLATERVADWLLKFHPLRHRIVVETAHRDHALILGFGAAGMWVVKPLQAAGYPVLVVDDDPAVIDKLNHARIPCLRGDGSDEKILAKAGARQARLIIASMRRVSECEKVLHFVKDVPVVVRVFEDADAERIRRLGGIPILNSEAAAETFMEWFEKVGRAHAAPGAEPRL